MGSAKPRQLPMHHCRTNTSASIWIGPVVSQPGLWHFFNTSTLGHVLRAGDRVRAFVGWVVDGEGTPVGFPPLHLHQ